MFLTNTILGAAKELPLLVYFNSERDIPQLASPWASVDTNCPVPLY
jgi:hypothetical protein